MNSNINKNPHVHDASETHVHGIDSADCSNEPHSSEVHFTETEDGYHLEVEIVGYVKDDFNFYINNNDLVLTTAKRRKNNSTIKIDSNTKKHTYCYPSALFRRAFHLPSDIVKNEIFVDYSNHILSIDLLKLNTKSNI